MLKTICLTPTLHKKKVLSMTLTLNKEKITKLYSHVVEKMTKKKKKSFLALLTNIFQISEQKLM